MSVLTPADEFLRAHRTLVAVRDVPGGVPVTLGLYKAIEENDLGALVLLNERGEQLLEVKAHDWTERLHPRDEHGRFAHTPGEPALEAPEPRVQRPLVRPAILMQVAENRARAGSGDMATRFTQPIAGESGWADAIETMARRRRMSATEYLKATRKRIAWLTAPGRAHVAVRVSSRILPTVLEQGHLVSAIDPTHLQATRHDAEVSLERKPESYVRPRGEWEQRVFGAHPVYGYLAEDDEAVAAQAVEAWGDVKLRLRDDVRDRATFVYSDSNYVGVGRPTSGVAPMALSERADHTPLEMALAPFMDVLDITRLTYDGGPPTPPPPLPRELQAERDRLERIKRGESGFQWGPGWEEEEKRLEERIRWWLEDQEDEGKWKRWPHGDFFETQIFGGVRTSDIESVVFTSAPIAAVITQLADLGIPWSVDRSTSEKAINWREQLHPRDAHGRFAHSASSGHGEALIGGVDTAPTMYHAAYTARRRRIQAHGLDPQHQQNTPNEHAPGVYLWDKRETAMRYVTQGPNMYGDFDIHAVDVRGLKLHRDTWIEEQHPERAAQFPGAYYSTEKISPERLSEGFMNPWFAEDHPHPAWANERKSAIAVPFTEALHPRDRFGRFADKPGAGGARRISKWMRQQMGLNWLGRHMTSSGLRRRGFGATPLALLVTTSERDMHDYAAPPLGRLLVPKNWSRADDSQANGVVVACDNGGFFGVDEPKYKRMCEKLKAQGVHPVWVTAPDVLHHLDDGTAVGDAKATIKRFEQWSQYLKHLGFPAAFVAQDGMDEPENLAWLQQHWDDIDSIFIGGSDAFKLGPAGAKLVQLAHENGKIVHIGRVNSAMRLAYCRDVLQADSCDGKQWAQFKKLTLEDGLDYIPSGEAPPTAVARRWVEESLRALETGSPWPRPPWQGHSWLGYFGEPLPENASEVAKQFYGHFSDAGAFVKALRSVVYYQWLSDAMAMVGLSDYWHLEMTAGATGFTIAYETDAQLERFTVLMELPAPVISDGRASWPDVLVQPGVEGENSGSATKAAHWEEAEHPRDRRGEFAHKPDAGAVTSLLGDDLNLRVLSNAAAQREGTTASLVAKQAGIPKAEAEAALGRLEKAGLLRRQPHNYTFRGEAHSYDAWLATEKAEGKTIGFTRREPLQLPAAFDEAGYSDAEQLTFPTGAQVATATDSDGALKVLDLSTFDPETDSPEDAAKDPEEWLYDIDPSDYLTERDFSKDFWEGVPDSGEIYYHGTTSGAVAGIKKNGLEPRSETRGMSNRGTGPAVFLHPEESYASEYYGSGGRFGEPGATVSVDLSAMKRDGLTPQVGNEEPLGEAAMRDSVAWDLGLEDFHDESSDYDGLDESTLIVYGGIPAKYIEVIR